MLKGNDYLLIWLLTEPDGTPIDYNQFDSYKVFIQNDSNKSYKYEVVTAALDDGLHFDFKSDMQKSTGYYSLIFEAVKDGRNYKAENYRGIHIDGNVDRNQNVVGPSNSTIKLTDSLSLYLGGRDGRSPYVGVNNHWWVFDDVHKAYVDTGIKVDYSTEIGAQITLAEQAIARVNQTNQAVSENEISRSQNEAIRVQEENTRVANEAKRVDDEKVRVANEAKRAEDEAERLSNETSRKNSEASRVNNEAARVSGEDVRVRNEASRTSEESTRVSNENARKSNETTRVNAESSRVSAEQSRVTEEGKRVAAETKRQNDTAQAIQNTNTAAQNATDVAAGMEQQIVQIQTDVNDLKDEIGLHAEAYWYGVTRKLNTASPDMTRIGWLDNHRTLPYHNRIRPCVVNSDRTINYWLDNDDITKKIDGTPSKLDGTDGQVMVYFPAGYILVNSRGVSGDNETYAIGLSPFSVDGVQAERFEAFVKSIDYATVKRSTNQLMCVINEDADYAGSGSGATTGGTGYPRTAINNYAFVVNARNLGADWINSFNYFEEIQTALMYIEYATYQLQKPYNSTLTAHGYKQGGLGLGPQNWSGADWSAYNGYYPVVKIGEVQLALCGSAQKGTGVYDKTIQATLEKTYTTPFPCWRWISNLWGHLWRWDSGVDIDMQPDTSDNPTSTVYRTKQPAAVVATSDSDFSFVDNYDKIEILPRVSGYVKNMKEKTCIINEIGGGTTSYCCAYFWTSIPANRERRGLLFGARLTSGGSALRASAGSGNRPSYSSAYFGSGLSAYVNE